ncbi:MAG: hypothetical protein M3Y07_05325 [Acidobacteriota bacterium]|nr:hypothetical protein [Acidobacteriota bacterium]
MLSSIGIGIQQLEEDIHAFGGGQLAQRGAIRLLGLVVVPELLDEEFYPNILSIDG